MLTPQPTEARPSTNDRDYIQVDAGLHPDMYGLADGNGNRVPRGCAYAPLAIANTPEYQAVIGKAADAQLLSMQWDSLYDDLSCARCAIQAAKPKTPEQESVRDGASRALGQYIGTCVRRRDDANIAAIEAREQLRIMELEWLVANRPPDNERFSGMGVAEFERRFGKEGGA
jgi:hypothetical protein